MTKEPGIYIVTLSNEVPISVNAQDPRYADKVYKANYKNVKVGKAKSLEARMENYFKTFGEDNVNFQPIILTERIDNAEKAIMIGLDSYRVRNPVSNRKTEWLIGITKDHAIEKIVRNMSRSGIEYSLAEDVKLNQQEKMLQEASYEDSCRRQLFTCNNRNLT